MMIKEDSPHRQIHRIAILISPDDLGKQAAESNDAFIDPTRGKQPLGSNFHLINRKFKQKNSLNIFWEESRLLTSRHGVADGGPE